MTSRTAAATTTTTTSSSTAPDQFMMNASYGEISYQSVATATEEGGDGLSMGGGGDDSSIDSLDNHPIVPVSHHHSYSSSTAVTTGATGTKTTIPLPSIPGPPAPLPLAALSPDSRRRRLIELDELLSDDEDEQDDHNDKMNVSHDRSTIQNLQNLYRNNRGAVVEEEDFDDDIMMMDDIINSYHETSSASDGDPNEPNDDKDDGFYDDITVGSGDDSDSGGEMGLNDEYPADVITPIRKRWKFSWFAEVHRRRMDEIPEEGRDELDDEEGSKSRRDKAWGSLDNHQRSWRSQRSVFLNIPINDGDTYSPGSDDTATLTAAAAVKKYDMLKGLFMEGMVKDLSPRGQMERLKKLALKNGIIKKSVAIKNSDVILADANLPDGTNDHHLDNVVPVVKILERHAQNKEAEEEYELIDSFRMMKRTALSKAKSKDRSKKASKKKKNEKDPTKSKSSKSTSGETKTKTSKGDATSNGEKLLKKKTKVKSTKSSTSSTTAAAAASDGPSPSKGVELEEVVSPKRKNKRRATISSPADAPTLMDDNGKRVSVSSATEGRRIDDHVNRKSAIAVTEAPHKGDHGKRESVFAPHKDDHGKRDDSSKAPVIAAFEVPLKDDNPSSHSKSKSRRKHKTEAGGGTEVENSSHSASKSRRKLKGGTSVVGTTTTSSDASVLNEKLSRSPSKSRRKLKADGDLDVKAPLSGSRSRRKLKVNTSEISISDEMAQSESSKTRSSSKSKHKSKSVDNDDAELKSPSRSKRTSKSKRGSSLRELDTSEIFDDASETPRSSTKTPKAKVKKAGTNVSLDKYIGSKSSGEEDKHDNRSVHSAPASSPTKPLRKVKSLDPGIYKDTTTSSRSRRLLENQPLTPSQTKHRSRSRSNRSRSPSRSPKAGKKSEVNRPLSMKEIGSPGLFEDEELSIGKKRGSRRSKTPEPLALVIQKTPKSMDRIRDEPASPNHSSSRKPSSSRHIDDSAQVSRGKK